MKTVMVNGLVCEVVLEYREHYVVKLGNFEVKALEELTPIDDDGVRYPWCYGAGDVYGWQLWGVHPDQVSAYTERDDGVPSPIEEHQRIGRGPSRKKG